MRKFKDIESGKIVTEEELRQEYLQKLQEQPEEFAEMCFADYIRNSLTAHNGTLEVCQNQRVAEEVLRHKLNDLDYKCWSHFEEILGEPINREEYGEIIDRTVQDMEPMDWGANDKNRLRTILKDIRGGNMEQQTKREEVIFDASIEIYGVYRDELSNKDIDSRDVFEEIRKFADFWMASYEPILGTVLPEDAYLEYVTLAALCWMKGYLGHDMTDDDELMLCNNQRVAQYVREHKMTLYDYDCWSNLEEVIGEPLTYEEFHKLNAEILDEPMSIAVCEGNRKDLKAKLDNIRKPKEKVPVYVEIRTMFKTWVEVNVGAGREEIIEAAKSNIKNEEYEPDYGWETDVEDILGYNIDWDGIQEV